MDPTSITVWYTNIEGWNIRMFKWKKTSSMSPCCIAMLDQRSAYHFIAMLDYRSVYKSVVVSGSPKRW